MFSDRVEIALDYASKRHAGQTRKASDVAYFTHPVHIALMLRGVGENDDAVIVSLLHDVLEDTCDSPSEQNRELKKISTLFGPQVAEAVLTLTEPKISRSGQPLTWKERKEAYLQQLRTGGDLALIVSLADKIHNLNTMLGALRQFGPSIWNSFHASPADSLWFHNQILVIGESRLTTNHPFVVELGKAVQKFKRKTHKPVVSSKVANADGYRTQVHQASR